jgi:predicted metal-dependent hydrolase
MPAPERLVPDLELPAYTYVPGRFPHPCADPAGHRFSVVEPAHVAGDRVDQHVYLAGIDLFNFGYYWEAHEAWERLWHAASRKGPRADFFKGLIQLAVVGVKLREGRSDGARTHATRAAELFASLLTENESYGGLDLAQLVRRANEAADADASRFAAAGTPVLRVFEWQLLPRLEPNG